MEFPMTSIYGGSDEDRHFERDLDRHLDEQDYDEAEEDEEESREWESVDAQIQDMADRDADYEYPAWREP